MIIHFDRVEMAIILDYQFAHSEVFDLHSVKKIKRCLSKIGFYEKSIYIIGGKMKDGSRNAKIDTEHLSTQQRDKGCVSLCCVDRC